MAFHPVRHWLGGHAGPNLKVPVANIKVKMDYIGGGFGSKFSPGAWAEVGATLSQKAGGRPVKIFLIAPANSRSPATGPRLRQDQGRRQEGRHHHRLADPIPGPPAVSPAAASPPLPYVYTNIPNTRLNHVSVSVNGGPRRRGARPTISRRRYLTCCAIEDFAAKVGVDPMLVFDMNAGFTPRAGAIDTSSRRRRKSPNGRNYGSRADRRPARCSRGLGIGVNAWGGGGHACTARTTINPDGSCCWKWARRIWAPAPAPS